MKRIKLRRLSCILVVALSLAFCFGNLCDDDDASVGLFVACVPPSFYQLAEPVSYAQSILSNIDSDIYLSQLMVSYLSMHEKSPPRPSVSILA